MFVSRAAAARGVGEEYGLKKTVTPVEGCRSVDKLDMRLNCTLPAMTVDPETYEVTADGVLLACKPAKNLPLAQAYFLF